MVVAEVIAYRFNLRALGFPPENYGNIKSKSLVVSRRAAAVDTGKYKQGWRTVLAGDYLTVFNAIRYAEPVELGSKVHTKHRHKIRNALSLIGLNSGVLDLGGGVKVAFSNKGGKIVPGGSTKENKNSLGGALKELINTYKFPLRRKKTIPTAKLFSKVFLLAALAARQKKEEQVTDEEEITKQ